VGQYGGEWGKGWRCSHPWFLEASFGGDGGGRYAHKGLHPLYARLVEEM
jgi:hypothetical protein